MVAFEPVAWLTWPQHITGQGLKDLPTVKGDPVVSAPIGRLGSAPVPMVSNRTPNEKSGNDAPGRACTVRSLVGTAGQPGGSFLDYVTLRYYTARYQGQHHEVSLYYWYRFSTTAFSTPHNHRRPTASADAGDSLPQLPSSTQTEALGRLPALRGAGLWEGHFLGIAKSVDEAVGYQVVPPLVVASGSEPGSWTPIVNRDVRTRQARLRSPTPPIRGGWQGARQILGSQSGTTHSKGYLSLIGPPRAEPGTAGRSTGRNERT